ncbi:sterol desaturase family protein, partial [uncultured Aquincola sp.]|uniref:sterol desaturase family protein n=1 Tax=uncultured Aquincola sp. TaxID=886556 RepID=UPI0032B2FE31
WRRPGRVTDLCWYFFNGLLLKWLLLVPAMALAVLAHAAVPSALHAWVASWPLGLRLAAVVVLGDMAAYWGHRWAHAVPALWRFHALHHSAEQMDWLVNTRAHPVDLVFVRLCGLVPLYALGLVQAHGHALDPVTAAYMVLGTALGFFVHANLRWRFGWLEQWVATPAFHHWHHTNDDPAVQDKNFAAIFPWIDRLFGTLHLPATWPQRYGTATPAGDTWAAQMMQPLRPRP